MERLKSKRETLLKAVASLKDAIDLYEKGVKHIEIVQLQGVDNEEKVIFEYEPIRIALRDSLIQRFEYTVDMLWKYIKLYLEEVIKIKPEIRGPKHIAREVGIAGIISEEDTQVLLDMIDSRNMTSHIYKEEIAQQLSSSIPEYYELIEKILGTMKQ
jgi:nucleotidyltransferase substrate binding protein (TIGR01987 family)